MGRPRSFTDEEVIDRLADVFAAHGFRGTSVQMLAEASGLGKQSLYNSFGDKQDIYLKALDCAVARFGGVAEEMARAPDGRRALHVFFERLLCQCISPDPSEQACIVSTGLLEGVAEPCIGQALQAKWEGSHRLLQDAVARGQADGSIANRQPAAALADLLITLMSGLRVTARAVDDTRRHQAIVAHALAVLDIPTPSPSG